jgi:hypothetical protein
MRIADRAPFCVVIDSREQAPLRFPPTISLTMPDGSKQTRPVVTRTEGLATGDYTCPALRNIAAVERKSPEDAASTFTANRGRFDREIERLRLLRFRAIVVESSATEVLLREDGTPRGLTRAALIGSVASFWARASVPVFFMSCADDAAMLTLGLLRRWTEEAQKMASRQRFAFYRRKDAA